MFAKRILKSFAMAAAITLSIAACGGGNAKAAPLAKQTYISSDGKIFSIDNVRKITRDTVGNKIVLTYVDGNSSFDYLADAGGAIFLNIKQTQPTLVSPPGDANVLYNPAYAKNVTCNPSVGTTTMGWYGVNGGAEYVADGGCVMFNAIRYTPN